jgi:uncharacterized repeat protein (TIGR02543 family)/uncharacterized repeat protein (TIGR01451 family)
MQFPVVADPYGKIGDNSARIVSIGALNQSGGGLYQGSLNILKAVDGHWAYTRPVWNQIMYNSVNVNDDVSVAQYPVNPAIFMPGADRVTGTSDDVQPFNSFLKQTEVVTVEGNPLWPAPDVIFDEEQSNASRTGDSITVRVCIANQGDAALGAPVYVTVYRDNAHPDRIIKTDSLDGFILSGATRCMDIGIPADTVRKYLPFMRLAVRLNDDGKHYPVQDECSYVDSVAPIPNPALSLMMKKRATLLGEQKNGTYPNPVSVLYGEEITYKITAVNANMSAGRVTVTDTLPPYLNYVTGTATAEPVSAVINFSSADRQVLEWEFNAPLVDSYDAVTVSYRATPAPGVSASQPMFVNRAWITASDTLNIVTDSATYHQGAGVSVVTFASVSGGSIFNAAPQAVDYRTQPRAGIVVAPDEGYSFAGWSHDEYYSLRGSIVPARSGIMSYDTLTVYGNVTLTANFELIDYPIRYYMNGCENPSANPAAYTVETGNILLEPPYKAGDVFVGWTGSNGEEPQMTVNIPKGSTGELIFYANFLVSGREKETEEAIAEDKIWSSGNTLYVTVSTPGSVIRIYSTDGVLQKQHTAISLGTAEITLPGGGIYVVTVNNGVGWKVRID